MKRSDMVKLIAGWIESNNNKFLDYEEIAKEVLLNIELCGMLPPIVSIPERCMCSMRSTCQDCSPALYETQWEKE